MYFFQEKMLFHPTRESFTGCKKLERLGGTAIEETIETLPVRYYHWSPENPAGDIVVFHGNAGSACDRAYFISALNELGFAVSIVEYPGYSGDSIRPSQDNLLRSSELAVRKITTDRASGKPLILIGESLGTAVATWVAEKIQPDRLILQAPFTSITDVAKRHYPVFPVGKLVRHPFPAHRWAPNVNSPVLVLHGEDDKTIPIDIGRMQAKHFPGDVQFIPFENTAHNDFTLSSPDKYWNAIRDFIRSSSQGG
jgi:alpha-beta hydrolase superfamily lysophospholipase